MTPAQYAALKSRARSVAQSAVGEVMDLDFLKDEYGLVFTTPDIDAEEEQAP